MVGALRGNDLDHRDAAIRRLTRGLDRREIPEEPERLAFSALQRDRLDCHFADELALARACSGLYLERHPAPDPDAWRAITDPVERLRVALYETYAYHRSTEAMMTHVFADARHHPVMAPYHAHWRRAADVLIAGRRARGRRRAALRAGIALALAFETWRTLVREQGLDDEQAAELMLRLTCDCAER